MKEYIRGYLGEMVTILQLMEADAECVLSIHSMINIIQETRGARGHIYFAGVGGGAGSGSHAANDFNKIAGVSTFCLSDNPSLLTALWNDEGAESIFARQMEMHDFGPQDVLFVFSVNGGKPDLSSSLMRATDYAHEQGGKVIAVLGRNSGYVGRQADAACIVPIVSEDRVTPHSETFQLAINHLIVNAIAANGEWQ